MLNCSCNCKFKLQQSHLREGTSALAFWSFCSQNPLSEIMLSSSLLQHVENIVYEVWRTSRLSRESKVINKSLQFFHSVRLLRCMVMTLVFSSERETVFPICYATLKCHNLDNN